VIDTWQTRVSHPDAELERCLSYRINFKVVEL